MRREKGLNQERLTLLPGVMDADYHGEIKVMGRSEATRPLQPGMRIAELFLLPYLKVGKSCQKEKGTSGFGS